MAVFSSYFTDDRAELYRFVEEAGMSVGPRVLNVGCAAGHDARHARALGGKILIGVEPTSAALAAEQHYDVVYRCRFEEFTGDKASFDTIVFADSLEHMVDPNRALKMAHALLTNDGIVICSVPNVRHITVLFDIMVKGDFPYAPAGILDATHLRFFTRKSFLRLLDDVGFAPTAVKRYGDSRLGQFFEMMIPGSGEFALSQFFVAAEKGVYTVGG